MNGANMITTHHDLFSDGRKLPLVKRTSSIIRLPSLNGSFCFADYEVEVAPLCWRILIQICATAMDDYNVATSPEDKETCKQKILNVLVRINAKALMTSPELLSFDMRPPTAEWAARNATGNWCAELIKQLTQLFTSA
jgi:hypothetical protein